MQMRALQLGNAHEPCGKRACFLEQFEGQFMVACLKKANQQLMSKSLWHKMLPFAALESC